MLLWHANGQGEERNMHMHMHVCMCVGMRCRLGPNKPGETGVKQRTFFTLLQASSRAFLR